MRTPQDVSPDSRKAQEQPISLLGSQRAAVVALTQPGASLLDEMHIRREKTGKYA